MNYRTPFLLGPIFRERIWGRKSLEPFFPKNLNSADTGHIGEVWFTFEENHTSLGLPLGQLLTQHPELLSTAADPNRPGICPLLIKLIFTTERLSVQVHPGDAYAELHHRSLGKTEAWYVVDTQPGRE